MDICAKSVAEKRVGPVVTDVTDVTDVPVVTDVTDVTEVTDLTDMTAVTDVTDITVWKPSPSSGRPACSVHCPCATG